MILCLYCNVYCLVNIIDSFVQNKLAKRIIFDSQLPSEPHVIRNHACVILFCLMLLFIFDIRQPIKSLNSPLFPPNPNTSARSCPNFKRRFLEKPFNQPAPENSLPHELAPATDLRSLRRGCVQIRRRSRARLFTMSRRSLLRRRVSEARLAPWRASGELQSSRQHRQRRQEGKRRGTRFRGGGRL